SIGILWVAQFKSEPYRTRAAAADVRAARTPALEQLCTTVTYTIKRLVNHQNSYSFQQKINHEIPNRK
ncbi:hypothetical protein ACJX0J_015825, partial [Zea mays]